MPVVEARPLTLADLMGHCVPEVELESSWRRVVVTAITDDSRAVIPGCVFVAVRGAVTDGHAYLEQAIAAGAVAVLVERPSASAATVPVVVVSALAERRNALAETVYGYPSQALATVGITGTNGKTSTAFHLAELAGMLGIPAHYFGTLGTGPVDALTDAGHTTLPAMELPARLQRARASGAQLAALEVSSHGLAQHRVAGTAFDVAVLTNFSRDHLDFHGTVEAYAQAKLQLFRMPGLAVRIVNADDALGVRIAQETAQASGRLRSYGAASSAVALGWQDLRHDADGVSGRWRFEGTAFALQLPLLGSFAVANVAAALLALDSLDLALSRTALVDAARRLRGVPGRMEAIRVLGQPLAIVDYAHTPDALRQALLAVRAHCRGRLWVVFGCGGDRDRGKRLMMGEAAAELADSIVVTSDNPRSEDPLAIIRDIEPALADHPCWHRREERSAAIDFALGRAAADDVVLIAGKGHEPYQEIAGERLPFDDRAIVRELLGAQR
ncbi:MAG: UDP-N-acetylmuramoyl-L-alanyl-D-glutamate--2,6-diaminopimelate ligase [Pseudomonadota bacterium]